jgi:signal transduction histidine kinase
MANDIIGVPGGSAPEGTKPLALLLDERDASASRLADGLTRRGYRVAAGRSLPEAAGLLSQREWRAVALIVCSTTLPGAWQDGRGGPQDGLPQCFPPVPLVLVGDLPPGGTAGEPAAHALVARLERPVTEAALDAALGRCARWDEEAARLVRYRLFVRQAQFVREPVARIVHDLNNQITGLKGGIDLLAFAVQQVQPTELRTRFARYLGEIIQPSLANIEQMFAQCRRVREQSPAAAVVDLVAAAREASALTAGPAGERLSVTVDGQALAWGCAGDLAARAEAGARTAPAPSVPALANADHAILIMAYLLENAFDAIAGNDQGQVLLAITGADARGMCAVSVFDNGPGIADEHRTLIWRSFYSAKAGAHAGLGLSFAKQLIDKHGGQIGLVPSPLGGPPPPPPGPPIS